MHTEPTNIFQSAYRTDYDPIRISYHGNVHYNSLVDPYKATIGVGLGLPGYQPGVSDKISLTDRDCTNLEDYYANFFCDALNFAFAGLTMYHPVKLCACFAAMSD